MVNPGLECWHAMAALRNTQVGACPSSLDTHKPRRCPDLLRQREYRRWVIEVLHGFHSAHPFGASCHEHISLFLGGRSPRSSG
jgi:hypothetical protein